MLVKIKFKIMSRIKSFHTYLTKENSNQLIMKYIRHKVTDDMGWMKPGMADWGIYSGDNLVAVFYLDDEKPDLFIRGLEIKEEFRGKGYGKKVLDLIRNYAKSKKYKFLTLNFYKSNDIAKKLYIGYGFIEDKYQSEKSPVINLRIEI